MDPLTRFDVAESNGRLAVVIESHFLPPDPAVVVIPLLPDYPAIRNLNPEVRFDGRSLILATRLILAVRRSSLRRVGNGSAQGDAIPVLSMPSYPGYEKPRASRAGLP